MFRRRGRPHPVGQGQGRHRCLPPNQPANPHDGSRAPPNHIQRRPPQQAFDPSPYPRPEPPLLLNRHQLPKDCAGGEHADEPAQARLDRGPAHGRLQG